MEQELRDQRPELVMLICLGILWHHTHLCSKDMVRISFKNELTIISMPIVIV